MYLLASCDTFVVDHYYHSRILVQEARASRKNVRTHNTQIKAFIIRLCVPKIMIVLESINQHTVLYCILSSKSLIWRRGARGHFGEY